MQITEKLPVGIKGISKMMKMMPEEVRLCPYFEKIRNSFKDFNYGVLSKDKLIENLSVMDDSDGKYSIFNEGIANAIDIIKACY